MHVVAPFLAALMQPHGSLSAFLMKI